MAKSKRIDDTPLIVKSKTSLRSQGIKIDNREGIKFKIPENIAKMIEKTFSFSVEQLSVGGNISLPDLAVHLDEQSSLEFHVSGLSEYCRHALRNAEDEYEIWYNKTYFKCREYLKNKGEKAPSEKVVVCRLISKYSKNYRKRKQELNRAELEYRLLNHVIRASVVTKGVMLPTLRNIIQGKQGDGISESFDGNKKVRKKLKVNDNGKKSKKEKKQGSKR